MEGTNKEELEQKAEMKGLTKKGKGKGKVKQRTGKKGKGKKKKSALIMYDTVSAIVDATLKGILPLCLCASLSHTHAQMNTHKYTYTADAQSTLEHDMEVLIEENEEMFDKVMQFEMKNEAYKDKRAWRQDACRYGCKAQVTEQELNNINVHTLDDSFDARAVYDLDSYLTECITRAHVIDPVFQDAMRRLFPVSVYHRGPVKGIARCKEKAEVEYNDCAFPKSAHIIDIIRCSLTFHDISSMWHGIERFCDFVQHSGDAQSTSSVQCEVMRVKNGRMHSIRI